MAKFLILHKYLPGEGVDISEFATAGLRRLLTRYLSIFAANSAFGQEWIFRVTIWTHSGFEWNGWLRKRQVDRLENQRS